MSTPVKKIAFHTLGCKLNFAETATMARDFLAHGYELVDLKDNADIYILNTCTVTENADKDCRKFVRQVQRRAPEAYIALVGCYAQLKPGEVSQIPGVDAILGMQEKMEFLKHLDNFKKSEKPLIFTKPIKDLKAFTPSYSAGERTRAFLKVQDGCDYNCSFCTIPMARGESRSDTISNTIQLAREIEEKNIREIVLTGVNIGDFGKNSDETFLQLMQELDRLDHIDRIRISSIEPNLLTNEMIDLVAESKIFVPHFHIPLQSGSNKILGDMQRRYKREEYFDRVSRIKAALPEASIGADVIVGFPSESDEDFLDTYKFITDLDITYLHVFSYSERDNTKALEISESVDKTVIKERSKMLHILSDKKRRQFQEQFIGSSRLVLFESVTSGKIHGHTDNYIKVSIEGNAKQINEILPVVLVTNNTDHVAGKLQN
jgi:threonylcarbamoyladenosine tRNA methylthiotransferase MtaB